MKVLAFAVALAIALPAAAQESSLEFEPRVGTMGTRVTITSPFPKGAVIRFGSRSVPLLLEPGKRPSFIVPDGAATSFVEARLGTKVVAKSNVPFVVAGASLVNTPKLIGLKEAIDVFGYAEPMPEGGEAPDARAKKILSFGEGDLLTIGEAPAPAPLPFAIGNDAASAATRGMGAAGFLLTARAPVSRVIVVPPLPPLPTPVPTPTPEPPAN